MSPETLSQAISYQRRGWTQERIAKELGLARETIARALSRHNRRVLKRLDKRAAEIKARHVEALDWIAEEASDAWERSKADAESVKTTTGDDGDKTETTLKGQTGNVAYLSQMQSAMADQRKILGLDAPPAKAPESDPDAQKWDAAMDKLNERLNAETPEDSTDA